MDLETVDILDLVYESEKDQVSGDREMVSQTWGGIRESLRQLHAEEGDVSWNVEGEQTDYLTVEYTAHACDHDIRVEGAIEGRIEDMDYF